MNSYVVALTNGDFMAVSETNNVGNTTGTGLNIMDLINDEEVAMILNFVNSFFGGTVGDNFVMREVSSNTNENSMYKFIYLGDTSKGNNHDGIITIATYLDRVDNEREDYYPVYYGVSFCSPKDKYSKDFGRDLAVSRTKKCENVVYIREDRVKSEDIRAKVIADIFLYDRYPEWAKKLVMGGLV